MQDSILGTMNPEFMKKVSESSLILHQQMRKSLDEIFTELEIKHLVKPENYAPWVIAIVSCFLAGEAIAFNKYILPDIDEEKTIDLIRHYSKHILKTGKDFVVYHGEEKQNND